MYTIARNWWVLVLRGALAILFGMFVFLWPELGWLLVVASFAAFALVDGVFAIAAATSGQAQGGNWWALIFQGLLGIAVALFALMWPEITELALLLLIAYWAIASGALAVVAAFRLRKEIEGEWALALSGILSIVFGLALIIVPAAGALAIAWLIAAYSIVFGVLLLALGFRLRTIYKGTSAVPRR